MEPLAVCWASLKLTRPLDRLCGVGTRSSKCVSVMPPGNQHGSRCNTSAKALWRLRPSLCYSLLRKQEHTRTNCRNLFIIQMLRLDLQARGHKQEQTLGWFRSSQGCRRAALHAAQLAHHCLRRRGGRCKTNKRFIIT